MNKNKNESGRSMVEMLGTLAIMGVLSIGGIAGYNYGINKHRANQVLQDIRLVYQELKYPNTVHQIVSEGSFPETKLDLQSPYEYGFDFANPDDFNYDSTSEKTPNLISVNVSGVSKTACDILLKNKPEYVLMLKANGQSVWTCDKSENKLNYIFEITTDKLEYRTCSVCTGVHCFDDDMNCPKGENCQNNVCSKCEPGHTLQVKNEKESCIKCGSIAYNNTITQENCYRCKGTLWGYILHSGGATQCLECGNGKVATTKELCEERCSHIDGIEYVSGYCLSCINFTYLAGTSKAECEKCMKYNDNIIFYNKYPNTTSNQDLCADCVKAGGFKNTEKTACICPAGQFWSFDDRNHSFCRDCSFTLDQVTSKIECDKCQNRYFDTTSSTYFNNDRNGYCKLCPEGQTQSADGRSCVDKPAS